MNFGISEWFLLAYFKSITQGFGLVLNPLRFFGGQNGQFIVIYRVARQTLTRNLFTVRMIVTTFLLLLLSCSVNTPIESTSNDQVPATTSVPVPAVTGRFGPPTADPRVFADTWFAQLLDDIGSNYPIEQVRLEVVDFLSRADRGEFVIVFSDEDTTDVVAMTGWEGSNPGVKFFGGTLVRYAQGCLWQVPCIEDMLAHAIVHERYHLDHHLSHSSPSRGLDFAALRRDETEAYWYSTANALVPMVIGGRLQRIKHGDTIELALDAYQLSENQESPAWQSFMDRMMRP